MQHIVDKAKHYCRNCKTEPTSFLFYGESGLGKTFLSNCIAKEVMEQGLSVRALEKLLAALAAKKAAQAKAAAPKAANTRVDRQIKALADRMGNLEKLTDSVNRLALSLEKLTGKQTATETQVKRLTDDVETIKDKPAKRWELVVGAVISALVGAGIALLIK